VFVETGLVLADPDTSPVMKLRAALQLQNMAAAAEAAIIADMAKASGWDGEDDTFTYNLDPVGRCWAIQTRPPRENPLRLATPTT